MMTLHKFFLSEFLTLHFVKAQILLGTFTNEDHTQISAVLYIHYHYYSEYYDIVELYVHDRQES